MALQHIYLLGLVENKNLFLFLKRRKPMLSYDDHAILILYRRFYDIDYPVKRENNTEAHIMAQKMCYLMDRSIIPVGDYGFFWGKYGPYSESWRID